MTPNPSLSPTHKGLLSLARLVCFLLGLLAVLVIIATIPQSISGMYTDWQVLGSYSIVKAILPYQSYAMLIWSLRYLAVTVFWLAAILIYIEVGLRASTYTGIGLFTSLVLFFIPPALLTGQVGSRPDLPPPWDAIV